MEGTTPPLLPYGAPQGAGLAASRLEAYERVVRAAAGPARVPVFYLNDEQIAALYAPRQRESLVERPLRQYWPACPGADSGGGAEHKTARLPD